MSGETDTVPYHRFTAVNEKLKEAEARIKELEPKASLADKLATQVETLKTEKKTLVEQHASELKQRGRHDALRDKAGIKDEGVRNAFLQHFKDAEDLEAAIDGLYDEEGNVRDDAPALLKPFVPQRSSGDEDAADQGASKQEQQRQPRGRLPKTDTSGRSPTGNQALPTPEQIASMSDEDLAAQLPNLAQQIGNPRLAAAAKFLAPAGKAS